MTSIDNISRQIENITRQHEITRDLTLEGLRNYKTQGPEAIPKWHEAPWELYYVRIIAWN